MTTQAEVLKTELEAGDYSGYRDDNAPDIKIKLFDDLQGVDYNQGIILLNKNGTPLFTFNGKRLIGSHFVDLIITESISTERDNLRDRLDAIFLASSFDITYKIVEVPDKYPKFSTVLRVKILT